MKESNTSNNSYAIDINKKKYMFSCPNGEEHVQELKETLTKIIDSVSGQREGHMLSDYAMKIAILLADRVVTEKNQCTREQQEIEEKISPLINELDRVLGIE